MAADNALAMSSNDSDESGFGFADELITSMTPATLSTRKSAPDQPGDQPDSSPVDEDGYTFDQAWHRVDLLGRPMLKDNGKLRKKPGHPRSRRPRPVTSALNDQYTSNQQSAAAAQVETETLADRKSIARKNGRRITSMLLGATTALGGEEWAPIKFPDKGFDEQADMEEAFTNWFYAKNIPDIPPTVELMLVIGAYAGLRLTMPATQSKLKGFLPGVLSAITGRIKKIFTRNPNNASQPDTGDDREREVDAS